MPCKPNGVVLTCGNELTPMAVNCPFKGWLNVGAWWGLLNFKESFTLTQAAWVSLCYHTLSV